MRVGRHWIWLPSKVAPSLERSEDAPSLTVFKARLYGALSNLL